MSRKDKTPKSRRSAASKKGARTRKIQKTKMSQGTLDKAIRKTFAELTEHPSYSYPTLQEWWLFANRPLCHDSEWTEADMMNTFLGPQKSEDKFADGLIDGLTPLQRRQKLDEETECR